MTSLSPVSSSTSSKLDMDLEKQTEVADYDNQIAPQALYGEENKSPETAPPVLPIDSTIPSSDPNCVRFDGLDDKENVRTMSTARKWFICLALTSGALCLTALSSAWTSTLKPMDEHFHSSEEVGDLGLTLYLVGLSVGPLLCAPLSEFYGRQAVYLGGLVLFFAFQFLTAFPNSMATALVGRFLTALGGSVFMSNVPGTFADLFERHQLSLPMTVFSLGPFLGPGLGALLASIFVQFTNYRWVFYTFIIWTFVLLVVVLTLIPETYPPVLLVRKAKRLRKETGNDDIYAPLEKTDLSILQSFRDNCTRPVILLIYEPVLLFLCFYTGFLLAIIYLFFVAFPLVFETVYEFDVLGVGLTFLGVTIGMAAAAATYPFWHRLHQKEIAENNGIMTPEMRTHQMITGAVISPIGLFMFAWTIYPSVHWIVPIIATAIFGFGCYFTFNGILTYTVETYRRYAASATAANVFVRCMIAGSAPLFGVQMLKGMGFHWAVSLLGFIAILLCPSAFIFRRYGKKLREKSRFAIKI